MLNALSGFLAYRHHMLSVNVIIDSLSLIDWQLELHVSFRIRYSKQKGWSTWEDFLKDFEQLTCFQLLQYNWNLSFFFNDNISREDFDLNSQREHYSFISNIQLYCIRLLEQPIWEVMKRSLSGELGEWERLKLVLSTNSSCSESGSVWHWWRCWVWWSLSCRYCVMVLLNV